MIGDRIARHCITILIELRKICEDKYVFPDLKNPFSSGSLHLMQVGTKIGEADVLRGNNLPESGLSSEEEVDPTALQGKVFLGGLHKLLLDDA